MKLSLMGDLAGLEAGLKELEKELPFAVDPSGIPVQVEQVEAGPLQVQVEEKGCRIQYQRPVHFFRGLGLLLEMLWAGRSPAHVEEEPRFDRNGAMFDCSRNAVFQPKTLRRVIRMMALMGLNMLMLYTEDTYTVEGEPYFGYMRGRYTSEELTRLDGYASLFGIEMIPCIQTLAHLASFLKWDRAKGLRDTEDVLLARSQETYQFLDRLIASVSRCFRSRRIHIGMDEAFGLGRGQYLDKYGYHSPFDIMAAHLKQVVDITDRYGLRPMIWSDMMFRMGSKDHSYYDLDAEIPDGARKEIPAGVQFVYWDYYHSDPTFYRQFIDKHLSFGSMPVFAGGVWTWAGPAVHYEKTFATTHAALSACKEKGVREVFATFWGDDGAETNMLNGLLGLQLFAEHGYEEKPSMEKLKKRFSFCTGGDFDAFWSLGSFDTPPGADSSGLTPDNPSKFLLWQDPLIGLFDRHVEGSRVREHYEKLHLQLKEHLRKAGKWRGLFEVPVRLSAVLARKCDLSLRIKAAYDRRDQEELLRMAQEDLPELAGEVNQLRQAHREQWMTTYKAFGWEVLDIRYGGVLARLDSAGQRLIAYCDGKIPQIEELEAERLGFDGFHPSTHSGMGKAVLYSRIASACPQGFR